MRTTRPTLLPLFRSDTQLRILSTVLSSPSPLLVGEIADRVDAPMSTVSREVKRLLEAGLFVASTRGRTRHVSPSPDVPWMPTLAALLDQTVGVSAIVGEALGAVDGVSGVWIYGSWAARRLGHSGPPPRDVDLVVVGVPSALDVAAARREVERRTDLEVDVRVVDPTEWTAPPPGSFLETVQNGPLVEVTLTSPSDA